LILKSYNEQNIVVRPLLLLAALPLLLLNMPSDCPKLW